MACSSTLAGRGLNCKDALGGIRKIFLVDFAEGMWADIASGAVAGLATGVSATAMKTYDMVKGTGSLTQTVTSDIVAGTVVFDQVVSVQFNKLEAADVTELQNLAKGRFACVVRDNNDNFFVVGHKFGSEVTGGTVITGQALGDNSGFTLELSAQDIAPAPFLDMTDPSTPADSDLTFDAAPA